MPKQIHAQNDLPNASRPSYAALYQMNWKGKGEKKSVYNLTSTRKLFKTAEVMKYLPISSFWWWTTI